MRKAAVLALLFVLLTAFVGPARAAKDELVIGMERLSNPEWQAWINLTRDQIQTAVFLQIAAGGHLLLFVVRARGCMFAVLMCGFGWFVVALPWTVIGLVWVYMLVWMLILDGVKLALYARTAKGDAGHTPWYKRFLKQRHPAHALGTAPGRRPI